jgi:hypothetical protein
MNKYKKHGGHRYVCGVLCRDIILSDNYRLPLFVGSRNVLTMPTLPAASTGGEVAAGSDKR